MINFIRSLLDPHRDSLQEGRWADSYTDPLQRTQIAAAYRDRWTPRITPLTQPHLFDPLSPPPGWRYDPYYECWFCLEQ